MESITDMAPSEPTKPGQPIVTADELRMQLLKEEMAQMERQRKAREAEEAQRAKLAEDFLSGHISEEERAMINRIVRNAVSEGKLEALVYTFPSDLCSDRGRAINNGDPNWPETLQGKAKELYDRYKAIAQPAGYKLKAMIVNFPGGIPGDVGFYLNWAPEQA